MATDVTRCAYCRADNPGHARYCMTCGAPLEEVHPEMIKLVTIVFVDMVGSTALTEPMDPEVARELMSSYFAAMAEEIRAEGGTVEKFIGDAVSAVFGVPTAHEDDPVRALRAARRMLARLDDLNAKLNPAHPIRVRIGVNTGAVSAERSLRDQMLVVGEAVNVAARLQQMAEPNTIIAGDRTARAAWGRFELMPLDPITPRGSSVPIDVFVVGDELPGGPVTEASGRVVPLVGRAAELETLRDIFTTVRREGTSRLVTILGEPGIGKSRLAREFIAGIGDRAVILSGRCLPSGEGVTLWPLREILVREAGIAPSDDRSTVESKLAAFMASLSPSGGEPSEQMKRALAVTVGFATENDPVDPRETHRDVINTWARVFAARATDGPVVVLIEDLHWADDSLLDLIAEVLDELEAPVMFVCPARSELALAKPEWVARSSHTSVTLDPLTFEQSWRLAATLLDLDAEPPGFRELVLDRAEGNPFFLEEISSHLLESERLEAATEGRLEKVDLPDRVQSVILARVDGLDPVARGTLQRAAVIGREFTAEALNHVVGANAPHVIAELVRRRFVVPLGPSTSGDLAYKFKHVLIRDVAYDSLPRRSRGEAHAATARWIEEKRGARADEVAELLANHYESAFHALGEEDLRESARRYWLAASRGELRRFSVERAEDFGHRAVELSNDGLERIEALEALGDVYHLAMRGEPAWVSYLAALDEVESASEAGGELIGRLAAKAAIVPTRWVGTMATPPPVDEIKSVIARGLDAIGETEDATRVELLVSSAFLQGMGYEPQDERGKAAADEAVAIARRIDDLNLESAALDAVGTWLWPEGRFGDIDIVNQERLRLVPRISDVREVCDIYLCAGRDASFIGRYHDAVEYLTRCVDRARGIDTGQYLHGLVWRVHPRFMIGDWDGALADHAEIEHLAGLDDDGNPPSYTMRAHASALFCYQLRGEGLEAERLLHVMRQHFERTAHAGLTFAGPLAVAARALAHRGSNEEAMSWLRLERWAYRGTHLEAACDSVPPDDPEAPQVLAAARSEAEWARLMALAFFADRLEGRIAAASGDRIHAIECFRRARAGFTALGSPWEAAYSTLLAAEVSSDGAGRAEDLRSALRAFGRLGARAEAERAQRMLEGATAHS